MNGWLPKAVRLLSAQNTASVRILRSFSVCYSLIVSSATLRDLLRRSLRESPGRGPPAAPSNEKKTLKQNIESGVSLDTRKRIPELNLTGKVVLVSGAARGLGLTQAEALLEAGATVYALDRLPEPSPDFYRVQRRAREEQQKSSILHFVTDGSMSAMLKPSTR